MQHEKIIKDERGTVRVTVDLITFGLGRKDADGNLFRYDVRVSVKPPKKKTEVYDMNAATEQEIHLAKTELWQKLKP